LGKIKTDLYRILEANESLWFIDLRFNVLMLPDIYNVKKTQNVCVEIWLHPLHPFLSWEFLVGGWEKKKWKLSISTFIILLLIVPFFGWLGPHLHM
jgi:hypothetical protein